MAVDNSTTYVFVDESGDLGRYGSTYFIIACLSTKEPKQIERIIKRIRCRKLKKKMKELNELKANSSSPEIRKAILQKLITKNCEIAVIVIKKDQVKDYLFEIKNRLYNYIFGLLISDLCFNQDCMEIIIDKKDSNKLLRADLDNYIARKISESETGANIQIKHLESHTNKVLQVVDFVAWSTHRKYSFNDDTYYKIIEPKVTSSKLLWN